jgi:hypothetical protein
MKFPKPLLEKRPTRGDELVKDKLLPTLLKKHMACSEAIEWAEPYTTLAEAWEACQRGDWMLWLAAKAKLCTRQQLVLAACECARLALRHVPAGEGRPLAAIETAEAWARGEAKLEQVRSAAAAAAYAAYAAYAAAAADAADAAAAAAADAAADADAAYAAAADVRTKTLSVCAAIVLRRSTEEGWKIK